jgi:hypothetical protein
LIVNILWSETGLNRRLNRQICLQKRSVNLQFAGVRLDATYAARFAPNNRDLSVIFASFFE